MGFYEQAKKQGAREQVDRVARPRDSVAHKSALAVVLVAAGGGGSERTAGSNLRANLKTAHPYAKKKAPYILYNQRGYRGIEYNILGVIGGM